MRRQQAARRVAARGRQQAARKVAVRGHHQAARRVTARGRQTAQRITTRGCHRAGRWRREIVVQNSVLRCGVHSGVLQSWKSMRYFVLLFLLMTSLCETKHHSVVVCDIVGVEGRHCGCGGGTTSLPVIPLSQVYIILIR